MHDTGNVGHVRECLQFAFADCARRSGEGKKGMFPCLKNGETLAGQFGEQIQTLVVDDTSQADPRAKEAIARSDALDLHYIDERPGRKPVGNCGMQVRYYARDNFAHTKGNKTFTETLEVRKCIT